jgi:hypothetical protein
VAHVDFMLPDEQVTREQIEILRAMPGERVNAEVRRLFLHARS